MCQPLPPLDLLAAALDELADNIVLTERVPSASSHVAIEASGLDHPDVPVALGRYAVGALAGAIGLDARLAADMLAAGVDARAELDASVVRLLGTTNVFSTEAEIRFRDTRRNAWIAEMLMHAVLVVRAHRNTDCLVGRVHAVSFPHDYPTIQGLDAVAVYLEGDDPVVAVGESKASREHGSGQLTSACDIFDAVELGDSWRTAEAAPRGAPRSDRRGHCHPRVGRPMANVAVLPPNDCPRDAN